MSQPLLIKDFSAGWCPSDDPTNGRKNGLLQMDSLELDQNGAIRLTGGSSVLFDYSAVGVDAHTIYSKFLATGQFRYVSFTSGVTYRNSGSIITSGSAVRTAFGAAFDYVIICSGSQRKKDTGTTVSDLGVTKPTVAPAVAIGAAGILNATYTYIQINVTANGAYVAKSGVGPESVEISPVDEQVTVDPENPGAGITEVWIFRRGGLLDQFYRVLRQTSSLGSSFSDNVSDSDALDEGVTLDLNALSVNSTDLPDDILEVVGPVAGRMIYFTKNGIHFSEANSPDSYLPGQSIYIAGGLTGAEMFLFAKKVGENVVLVGTTKDFYILTGTFLTQLDGTLDVYFRHLGVENPPISIDADTYNGALICMTAAGWKITMADGGQVNLCDERVDRLYRGETLNNYGGVPIYLLPQYRYSCCVIRDKLYVRVPQIVGGNPLTTFTYRMEVYDFKRKYWRPLLDYSPLMIFGQEDDAVMGFFSVGKTLRSIDDQFTRQNNGSNQTIVLKTSVFDAGAPNNRKDTYTLKIKVNTGNTICNLYLYTNNGNTLVYGPVNLQSNGLTQLNFDLSAILIDNNAPKNWQVLITGSPAEFLLTDITIDYELRPTQLSSLLIIAALGPNKKRIRAWPFKIHNLSSDVTCTPYIDGVAGTASTFGAANYEKTFFHHFLTDIFAVDYKFKLTSTALFELYESNNPETVQVLPVAVRFYQFGPMELFKYGKLKEFWIRLIAFGGTTIPYKIYFEDTQVTTGNITVVSAKEGSFKIDLPKTTAGTILRIELGPTAFDFHPLYVNIKATKSGSDSDLEWINLERFSSGV